MNATDRSVRHEIYRRFVETARAPNVAGLARSLDLPEKVVATSFRRLAAERAIVLRPDPTEAPGPPEIGMAHPFSAVPTSYPVRTGDHTYWANCAWDALAMPYLLDADADTVTECPDCGDALWCRTRNGRLETNAEVVHFLVPPRDFWDDIGFT